MESVYFVWQEIQVNVGTWTGDASLSSAGPQRKKGGVERWEQIDRLSDRLVLKNDRKRLTFRFHICASYLQIQPE